MVTKGAVVWSLGALLLLAGCGSAGTLHPAPSSSPRKIALQPDGTYFVVADARQRVHLGAAGGLTADQAIRRFAAHDPEWSPSSKLKHRYGFFTLENGESGHHYKATPAWAVILPGCIASHDPNSHTREQHCEVWLLLDAYSGNMLVALNGRP